MIQADSAEHRTEIRWLFRSALVIFIVTVVIGILNGTKALGPLERNVILTHVHAGTLGWITLGVFGVALSLFGGGSATTTRRLTMALIATVVAYVAAFYSGNFPARAAFGVVILVAIVLAWLWTLSRARGIGWGRLTAPQLGISLALTNLVVGSTLGVYGQILFASGNADGVGAIIGAHVGMQVAGYLVVAAASVGEWLLRRSGTPRHWTSTVMLLVLFFAGLAYAVGIGRNLQPLLGIGTLLQLVGGLLFIGRMFRPMLRVAWLSPGADRHFAIAVPFLAVNIALTVYLIGQITGGKQFEDIPAGIPTALDHAIFVGVMTNVIFGLIHRFTGSERWAWADHVVFWGMNAGVAAFIVVLILAQTSLEAVTAPVMGVSILVGIVVSLLRLRSGTLGPIAAAARVAA